MNRNLGRIVLSLAAALAVGACGGEPPKVDNKISLSDVCVRYTGPTLKAQAYKDSNGNKRYFDSSSFSVEQNKIYHTGIQPTPKDGEKLLYFHDGWFNFTFYYPASLDQVTDTNCLPD